jgi:hypothetical protein
MPIILAIEPDRLQAARLATAVRRRVKAELILADTTEGALDAIGDRMPDMVLVPALLAPQDDAALAAALRVIAAATHVRTLTIPVLASASASAPAAQEGLLSRWRRGRAAPAPDGCEPDVFADQIAAYLKEAAEERAEFEPDMEAIVETAGVMARAEPDAVEAIEILEVIEPEVVEPEVVEEPQPQMFVSEEVLLDDLSEPLLDLSDEIAALAEETDEAPVEEFAGEPVGVYTMPAFSEEAIAEPLAEPMPEPQIEARADVQPEPEPEVEPALESERVPEPEPVLAAAPHDFAFFEDDVDDAVDDEEVHDDEVNDSAIDDAVPMMMAFERLWPPLEGVPIEIAGPERTEWSALVASLRQDIEQRSTRKPAPPPKKRQKPIQDEWGFFDPEQCGFSALLAKLEEITETETADARG